MVYLPGWYLSNFYLAINNKASSLAKSSAFLTPPSFDKKDFKLLKVSPGWRKKPSGPFFKISLPKIFNPVSGSTGS